MVGYPLQRLTDRASLLEFLGIEEELFTRVITFDPPGPAEKRDASAAIIEITLSNLPVFFRHDIPKRNAARGSRTVWEPFYTAPIHKALARRLNVFFGGFLAGYPHEAAFGYRPKRNIRENAAVHTGHVHLLSVDIKDFFPSISRGRIQALFEQLSVKQEVAEALSQFVTIGNALPLGLPTSPVISNAIALPLDQQMHALARQFGASYSRYSDDMAFSGDGVPDLSHIAGILGEQGFQLAAEKTRRSKLGQSHYVTGLSVSDPARPHVPRFKKRKLRQQLYYARKFGLEDHLHHLEEGAWQTVQSEVNRLDGLVKFVAHHEPGLAANLKDTWREILTKSGARPSFTPINKQMAPFDFFIDEAEWVRGDQRYLALCMVTTRHRNHIIDMTKQVWLKLCNDLWTDGDSQGLAKKGLHFTEATPDQRLAFVKQLAVLPLEAHVAFSALDDDYEATYLRLLDVMLPRRLMGAESKFATLTFEKNSKVSQPAVTAMVARAHRLLEETDNRRPLHIATQYVAKPNFGISAPDFFLGTLGQYLRSVAAPKGKPEPRDRLMFDRLRDRYRVILDLSENVEYTRRNPIVPWDEQHTNAASC
jgi:hypothetical protein